MGQVFTCGCDLYNHRYNLYTHACIYIQECSVHLLVHLLFPWVQCHCLKPVLSQCSQTGFVTGDDFIALYTRCSYVIYSHGCNVFIHARTFFTLADTITPIFTVVTEVWPRANRAMVTNNFTVIIKITSNRSRVNRVVSVCVKYVT